ncbi:hypothetical protein V6O07_11505 [Arthrospira platensis SPKY2]
MNFKILERKYEYIFNDYGINNLKNKIRIVRHGDNKLIQWFNEQGLSYKCKFNDGTVEKYDRDNKGRLIRIYSNDKLISTFDYDDETRTTKEYEYDIKTGELINFYVRIFDYNHPDRLIISHSENYMYDNIRSVEWIYDDK